MADDTKKGAEALYDNESSPKRESAPATETAAEPKGEKKAVSEVKKSSDKFLEAIKGLHKSHEAERRDFHGNMREQFRTMASRHEKAFRDMLDGMETADAEEAAVGAEDTAAVDTAMAAEMPAAAPEMEV